MVVFVLSPKAIDLIESEVLGKNHDGKIGRFIKPGRISS